MKKALLSFAAVAMALAANAQGLTPVGADIAILPAARWSKNVVWSAQTYVINSGTAYGDWSTENPNYNVLCGDEPAEDFNGNKWYDVDYDTTDELTIGENMFTGDEIMWEEHNAPFSNDEYYNGWSTPSYRWTTNSVMADIYFRRDFTYGQVLTGKLYLACGHDDAPCEYYLNGTLVWEKTGWEPGDGWNNNEYADITDYAYLLKTDGSKNVLAVHVHQNWGGAFADAGLYTKMEGGQDMGYVTPWEGRTIFNSWGGYNFNGQSAFRDAGAKNKWEILYEAGADDVYTIKGIPEILDDWGGQLHFKTPIDIKAGKTYTFKCSVTPTLEVGQLTLKLCGNEADDNELYYEQFDIDGEDTEDIEVTFTGEEKNLKIVFDFCWTEQGETDVEIKNMSLVDDEGNELWVGTHYFNYFYFTKNGEQIKTPVMTGRNETYNWTKVDFDDSQWDATMFPLGSEGYMSELQTIWPGNKDHLDYTRDGGEGENTGYWIRRTFDMETINPNLEYYLLVCHDDDYRTYVNGVQLQEYTHWTNGKNPEQERIPKAVLNVGKNVIATEIHQNWGGRFYDCGVGLSYVDIAEQQNAVQEAVNIGLAFEGDLTLAMKDSLNTLIAEGLDQIANNNDAWELREYAAVLKNKINTIIGWSADVVAAREAIAFYGKLNSAEVNKYLPTSEAFEACKTPGQLNNITGKLPMARKRDAQLRHWNQYKGSAVAEGDFFIYNVGERLFLGGGESWGAHCALEFSSNAMTLAAATAEVTDAEGNVEYVDGYTVQTHRPNGAEGVGDFMGYNGYMDVSAQDVWVFEPVEGKENVYTIRRAGANGENGVYLGYRGGDNQNGYSWCTVDSDMRTPELASNQWMLITKEELNALATTASAENPVDMTHLIINPGFDQRLTLDNWTISSGSVWGRGGDHPDFVYECWNNDANLMYEITDEALLPGWYTLEFNGYYREGHKETHNQLLADGEEIEPVAVLYVESDGGDEEITLPLIHETDVVVPNVGWTYEATGQRLPDSCTQAAEFFEVGAYNNIAKFKLADGELLTFGIEAFGTEEGRWTVVDNFRLKYWGATDPGDVSGVEAITVATPAQQTAIYNLAGQKLQKAAKGVNIINGKKYIVK